MSAPSVVTFATCPVPSCTWQGEPQIEYASFERTTEPTVPAVDAAVRRSRGNLTDHLLEQHGAADLVETIHKLVPTDRSGRVLKAGSDR